MVQCVYSLERNENVVSLLLYDSLSTVRVDDALWSDFLSLYCSY
jgi:hypothetical protein